MQAPFIILAIALGFVVPAADMQAEINKKDEIARLEAIQECLDDPELCEESETK